MRFLILCLLFPLITCAQQTQTYIKVKSYVTITSWDIHQGDTLLIGKKKGDGKYEALYQSKNIMSDREYTAENYEDKHCIVEKIVKINTSEDRDAEILCMFSKKEKIKILIDQAVLSEEVKTPKEYRHGIRHVLTFYSASNGMMYVVGDPVAWGSKKAIVRKIYYDYDANTKQSIPMFLVTVGSKEHTLAIEKAIATCEVMPCKRQE